MTPHDTTDDVAGRAGHGRRIQIPARIPEAEYETFKRKIGSESVNSAIVRLMKQEAASPASANDLAEIFATRVIQLLQGDKKWALDVVRTAQLRWLPEGMLKSRMLHYGAAKQMSAEKLAEFLGQRIRWLIEDKKMSVNLLLDAGSGVFYVAQSLWSRFGQFPPTTLKSLTVYTHNLAVADDYAEQCHTGVFGVAPALKCELLGGLVDHNYAAATGPTTAKAIEGLCRSSSPKHKNIAIISGNFIRLDPDQSSTNVPIPLIRGAGQKPVKEALIRNAHELYLAGGSIGRLIIADNHNANTAILGPSYKAGQYYEDVAIPKEKWDKLKLVSGIRMSEESLLHAHSTKAKQRLPPALMVSPVAEISTLGHLLYPFDDDVARLSPAEQIKIEFPHIFPNMRDVLERYFSVDIGKLNVSATFWAELEAKRVANLKRH